MIVGFKDKRQINERSEVDPENREDKRQKTKDKRQKTKDKRQK